MRLECISPTLVSYLKYDSYFQKYESYFLKYESYLWSMILKKTFFFHTFWSMIHTSKYESYLWSMNIKKYDSYLWSMNHTFVVWIILIEYESYISKYESYLLKYESYFWSMKIFKSYNHTYWVWFILLEVWIIN